MRYLKAIVLLLICSTFASQSSLYAYKYLENHSTIPVVSVGLEECGGLSGLLLFYNNKDMVFVKGSDVLSNIDAYTALIHKSKFSQIIVAPCPKDGTVDNNDLVLR